jgi:hypothetical protein
MEMQQWLIRKRATTVFAVTAALTGIGAITGPAAAASGSSVNGGGSGFFPLDGPAFAGDRVQLEISARAGQGGRFNAVHNTAHGAVFTHIVGDVDCVSVEGNVAVATGVITNGFAGSGIDPIGTRVSFRITDAETDVFAVDLEFFSGHVIAPCSSDPILAFSVEQGNFVVRE